MENQKEYKQRTDLQNRSLHKYCTMLSDTLVEGGITYKKFLEIMDEVDMSPEIVKSVFREYGRLKYGKKSTADLTTKEMMEIFDEFTSNISKIGVYVPWPSQDELYYKNNYKNI